MSDEFYQMVKGVSEAASQPLCKLIEAVRAGVGLAYEPTHIRRVAKAEAEALVVREQTNLALSELRQRAVARLTNTEMRRQHNIERIVESASQDLPEECSEQPVDPDWMADFFDCCKDIGNEEVQSLWGKLLAGEVADPGSYSRRAVNTLKLMNSAEAAVFMLIGFRIWKLDGWPVLLIPGNPHSEWPEACPFRWNHISTLADIDLLKSRIVDEHHFIGQSRGEFTFAAPHAAPFRVVVALNLIVQVSGCPTFLRRLSLQLISQCLVRLGHRQQLRDVSPTDWLAIRPS